MLLVRVNNDTTEGFLELLRLETSLQPGNTPSASERKAALLKKAESISLTSIQADRLVEQYLNWRSQHQQKSTFGIKLAGLYVDKPRFRQLAWRILGVIAVCAILPIAYASSKHFITKHAQETTLKRLESLDMAVAELANMTFPQAKNGNTAVEAIRQSEYESARALAEKDVASARETLSAFMPPSTKVTGKNSDAAARANLLASQLLKQIRISTEKAAAAAVRAVALLQTEESAAEFLSTAMNGPKRIQDGAKLEYEQLVATLGTAQSAEHLSRLEGMAQTAMTIENFSQRLSDRIKMIKKEAIGKLPSVDAMAKTANEQFSAGEYTAALESLRQIESIATALGKEYFIRLAPNQPLLTSSEGAYYAVVKAESKDGAPIKVSVLDTISGHSAETDTWAEGISEWDAMSIKSDLNDDGNFDNNTFAIKRKGHQEPTFLMGPKQRKEVGYGQMTKW